MVLNKGDVIKDGEKYFSVFCIMGSVVYVTCVSGAEPNKCYELEEILKYYRKIEIIGDEKND